MANKREGGGAKKPAGTKAKGGEYRAAVSGRYITASTAKAAKSTTIKAYREPAGKSVGHVVETVGHTRHISASVPQASPYSREAQSEVVRARIHPAIKDEAAAILASMGLTVSDAFRLLMMRVVAEKGLPFSPLVPNEETIEAMRAARRGELATVGSVDELLMSLDADD